MASVALEEYELMKNSKYRMYVSAVDKALKSFEYTSEWADLISALGKLNKVLLNHLKFPVIPRRIKISKRLAQCMHPALPSGVHLKALETYDIIFKCMGTNRLSHELFIYSAGLFPLLGHAAMNVRPSLLTVYETHFVPLGERLRPGLSGFLSGVLPGLEEGSDHFERTNCLLEKVCAEVGPSHFYGCLWDCLASNSGIRLPAITFVLSHFNKKLSMEDQIYVMGTNVDIMVNALCSAVQDNSVLVQRNALDFLLVGFPMHNSQLIRDDMVQLVTAALVTILRRDMSLNRRLFAWLLGSEVNLSLLSSEHPLVKRCKTADPSVGNTYFHFYSKDMLVQAIKATLGQSIHHTDLRPYRLLVSLLDKSEIGPVILDDILYEVFRTLYLACENNSEVLPRSGAAVTTTCYKGSQELLKSANLLFSTLEPCYIWLYAGTLFVNASELRSSVDKPSTSESTVKMVGSGPPNLLEVCTLTEFLLDIVSLETYMDIPSEHLPGLFLQIITQLTKYCNVLSPHDVAHSLQLCAKILSRVQPAALPNPSENSKKVVDQQEVKIQQDSQVEIISSDNSDTSNKVMTNGVSIENDKQYSESNIPTKVFKSNSKFRIKQFNPGLNYQNLSHSTPVLLSVVMNEETENSESQERQKKVLSLGDLKESRISDSQTEEKFTSAPKLASECSPKETCSTKTSSVCEGSIPLSSSVPTKHHSVLEQCLKQYEHFFVKFVGGHQIINNGSTSELFHSLLIVPSCVTETERTASLEALLSRCLQKHCVSFSDLQQADVNMGSKHQVTSMCTLWNSQNSSSYSEDCEEAMKVACSLLVELSTFPSYCLPAMSQQSTEESEGQSPFPEWLEVLVVCACWLHHNPSLQLIAISTLLDLISLLRSQCDPEAAQPGTQGVVSVVMVPLLKQSHVLYIEQHTSVVQVLAHSLWNHLAWLSTQQQMVCVELLHQLHNVLPYNTTVENVIGESLTEDNIERKIEAFQRFATLWHVGREVETKAGINKSLRTFERSLLKMFDNLQFSETCPLKLQAQSWLFHSLLRGDISRLLDPLLFILLDPVTARVSVLHVNIEHSNTVVTCGKSDAESLGENSVSAKIYAISSVDGNVIYHVSDSTDQRKARRIKQKNDTNNPVRARRIFAVTSLVSGGSISNHYITEKNSLINELEPPPFPTQNQNISVFVNPFTNTTNSNNSSNDSATEDDSTHTSYDINVTTPEFIRNATRFMSVKKSKSVNGDATNESVVSSTLSKHSSSEHMDRFETVCQDSGQNSKEGCGEMTECSDSGSHKNGEFELANGQRWPGGEDMFCGLEVSTTAEDYFGNSENSSSFSVVEEILHDVLNTVVKQCMDNQQVSEQASTSSGPKFSKKSTVSVGVHPLHTHMLLYCGVYDSRRTLYALHTLRNVLLTNARMFLCAVATTGLANCARSSGLLTLLARHRKSVFGRNFHGDISTSSGELGAYRSSMYLEVLISVCLYFARSYYPNLGQMRLTQEEISGNRQVQLASAELLMLICSELILIVRDSGKGFSCYVADLMGRCKVQKVVLHCLLSSVYNMKATSSSQETMTSKAHNGHTSSKTFTEEIVMFNDPIAEGSEGLSKCKHRGSEHSEGFQVQLLRLILALIMLEHQVNSQKGDADITVPSKETAPPTAQIASNQLKYSAGYIIPQQPMFLGAILSALKQDHIRHLHQHWTTLVSSSLPFMGQSLTHIVMHVINQLCLNIKNLAKFYGKTNNQLSSEEACCLPADYTVTQLEALTVLCHYCLLDTTQQLSHAFSQQLLIGTGSVHMGIPGANPGQIFNNLIHVFMPTPLQQDPTANKEKPGQSDSHIIARRTVLGNLPHIIASVATLWQAIMSGHEWEQRSCVLGSPRVVKHHVLEFLSPISLHHGANFLAAIALAWKERKQTNPSAGKVVPVASPDQQVLVYLIGAIRAMPIDTLVQTVHHVLKQPSTVQEAKQDLSLEVSVLELFFCYMQTNSGGQLAESWTSLLGLLRDGLTLTPPAQFLMLAILNEFVQKCPPLAEKKDQRDLQDITSKLVESCAQIAGACLEQTTWLRRNLAVREKEPLDTKTKEDSGPPSPPVAQYSVQAQSVLAELLAPLLDVAYGSQEKERVVVLLTGIMYNITPYLKNHSPRNVPSFHACSQLLASLSSYQYTRKAWRRDVFDLLLDPTLFQMEANCLPYWRTIVDNLMTHDNTTFRDLMSRVALAQSASLSIFSSREQEYEQRAQLLKRLAFVILCSETDQYHKYMPEIQERLADSLRLPQVVPSVQAQVFLCFRVLLLRMSPQHVTSLWPIIISEMVQVFLHIEQELSTDTEEFSSHIRLLSALDSSWVVNSNNGLHAHGHPHWLHLQLAAAKLLDMAVLLPAHRLPQFQMYRWAFVGDTEPASSAGTSLSEDEVTRTPEFVPHVTRIAHLMDAKFQPPAEIYTRPPGHLMLTKPSIQSLQELHTFFTALSMHSPAAILTDMSHTKSELEAIIERDFLDKLPGR